MCVCICAVVVERSDDIAWCSANSGGRGVSGEGHGGHPHCSFSGDRYRMKAGGHGVRELPTDAHNTTSLHGTLLTHQLLYR